MIEILAKYQPKEWLAVINTCNGNEFRMLWCGTQWSGSAIGNDTISEEEVDIVEIFFRPMGNQVCGDYIATITSTSKGAWTLEECFYPTDGEFGDGYSNPNRNYVSETQINIFGEFKTFSGAFRNLIEKGNSTLNHRKPIEVYV